MDSKIKKARDILKDKPRPDLDKKYPGFNFMEVVGAQHCLVATTKNVTGQAYFGELDYSDYKTEADMARELVKELDDRCTWDKLVRRIHQYHTPEDWQELKDALRDNIKPSKGRRKKDARSAIRG